MCRQAASRTNKKRPATSAGLDLGLYAALFNASRG